MQYLTNEGFTKVKTRISTIVKWLPFVVAAALAVKSGSINPAKMIECLGQSTTTPATPTSPSSSADTSVATKGGDEI